MSQNPLSQLALADRNKQNLVEVGVVAQVSGKTVGVTVGGSSNRKCVPPRDAKIEIGDTCLIIKPANAELWYITNVYPGARTGKPDAISNGDSQGEMPNFRVKSSIITKSFVVGEEEVWHDVGPYMRIPTFGRPIIAMYQTRIQPTILTADTFLKYQLRISSDLEDTPDFNFRQVYSGGPNMFFHNTTFFLFANKEKGVHDFVLQFKFDTGSTIDGFDVHTDHAFVLEL